MAEEFAEPRLSDTVAGAPIGGRKLTRKLIPVLTVLVLGTLAVGLVAMRSKGPPVQSREDVAARTNTEPAPSRNIEDLLPKSLVERQDDAAIARSALAAAASLPKLGEPPGAARGPMVGAPLPNAGAMSGAAPLPIPGRSGGIGDAGQRESASVPREQTSERSADRNESMLIFAFPDKGAAAGVTPKAQGAALAEALGGGDLGKAVAALTGGGMLGSSVATGGTSSTSANDLAALVGKFVPGAGAGNSRSDPAKTQTEFNARLAAEKPADAPLRATERPTGFRIWQGTLIPAVLRSAIDSEQAGQVVAHVSQDVYDSRSQRVLLVPRNSQLIGQYAASFADGQNRLLFAFTRLILPDGRSVSLGSMAGSDSLGRAGVGADVDNRFLRRFSSAAVSAMLGIAADRLSARNQGGGTTINVSSNPASAATQAVNEATRGYLSRESAIGPVARVAAGQEIRVSVNRDIELSSWSDSLAP